MRIRSFARYGWLASVGVWVLLGACGQIPTCADPGTESPNKCYYKLKITEIVDQQAGLVKGTVDQRAVEVNADRFLVGFDMKGYTYFVYRFNIKDLNTAPEFQGGVKGKTFEFCNVPNSPYLELAPATFQEPNRCS